MPAEAPLSAARLLPRSSMVAMIVLAAVLATGLVSSLIAVRAATASPMLASLKAE